MASKISAPRDDRRVSNKGGEGGRHALSAGGGEGVGCHDRAQTPSISVPGRTVPLCTPPPPLEAGRNNFSVVVFSRKSRASLVIVGRHVLPSTVNVLSARIGCHLGRSLSPRDGRCLPRGLSAAFCQCNITASSSSPVRGLRALVARKLRRLNGRRFITEICVGGQDDRFVVTINASFLPPPNPLPPPHTRRALCFCLDTRNLPEHTLASRASVNHLEFYDDDVLCCCE